MVTPSFNTSAPLSPFWTISCQIAVDNLQFLDLRAPLKVGIQTFHQDMRVKVLAYWVPLGFAKSLCEALRSCQRGSVGSIDTCVLQLESAFRCRTTSLSLLRHQMQNAQENARRTAEAR